MPQKKSIKKTTKPAAKKIVPAKKATPKAVKKPIKKSAPKVVVKPAAKIKPKSAPAKKAAQKTVSKSTKTIKKAATPVVKHVVAKPQPKADVNKHDKQIKLMPREKKQE